MDIFITVLGVLAGAIGITLILGGIGMLIEMWVYGPLSESCQMVVSMLENPGKYPWSIDYLNRLSRKVEDHEVVVDKSGLSWIKNEKSTYSGLTEISLNYLEKQKIAVSASKVFNTAIVARADSERDSVVAVLSYMEKKNDECYHN